MRTRKNTIEFWRFIFAISIVAMHFNETFQIKLYGEFRNPFFPGAGLGVDFFFILSVFLMLSTYQRNIANKATITPGQFIAKKICNIKNEYFTAFFLLFIYNFVYKIDLSSIFSALKIIAMQLFQLKWELLMLHMSEFGHKIYINYPTWYISVMLIGIYFCYAVLFLNKNFYIYFFAPFMILIAGGYLANTNGTTLLWYEYNGFFNTGWIRCIVDISAGCLAFQGYEFFCSVYLLRKQLLYSLFWSYFASSALYMLYARIKMAETISGIYLCFLF